MPGTSISFRQGAEIWFAGVAGACRPCTAVRLQGRQFPVEVYYTAAPEESYVDAALATVLQVHADSGAGDILVFLTGQEEIEAVQRLLLDRF